MSTNSVASLVARLFLKLVSFEQRPLPLYSDARLRKLNNRTHCFAGQLFHEPIQETRLHQMRVAALQQHIRLGWAEHWNSVVRV
jgi:hypothetical protein